MGYDSGSRQRGSSSSSRRRSQTPSRRSVSAARGSASSRQTLSSKRQTRARDGKPTKADRQLAKLEAKNAKLKEKNARRNAKQRNAEAKRAGTSRAVPHDVPEGPQRVGDIRKRERELRNRKRYRRYVLRVVASFALVLLIVFAAAYLYRSDVFAIEHVNANGVTHLTSEEITELAAVSDDSTLLRLDAAGIVERLESNAWVQSATLSRVFPDTVEIDIVEREPAAVVQLDENTLWVIAEDGTWLSAATEQDVDDLMLIAEVSGSVSDPVSGSGCDDAGIENALAVIEGMSDEFLENVESISAESSIKTSLNLANGVIVAFGDSSDIELKESVINELLETYEGTISYINVRVPTRPTYRTLSS